MVICAGSFGVKGPCAIAWYRRLGTCLLSAGEFQTFNTFITMIQLYVSLSRIEQVTGSSEYWVFCNNGDPYSSPIRSRNPVLQSLELMSWISSFLTWILDKLRLLDLLAVFHDPSVSIT